jgi:hypothetical protein
VVNKAPVEVKPHPDALTSDTGVIREKVEPGRDVFEAHPIDQVNQSLEAALTKTGAHAPVDPGEKKKLDEEMKKKEEARKSAQKEVEKLAEEVGPLLPSDLAKVEEERKKEKAAEEAPIGVQMIQEGDKLRKQLEKQQKEAEERAKNAEGGNVDMTAVELVEADVKIQTVPNEKKGVVDDAE